MHNISNLPLTYWNKCNSKNTAEKAALQPRFICTAQFLWPRPDGQLSFAAMSCEVQLNTLQGDVITLDVVMTATVRELKAMVLEKKCQDPIERKVLKVDLVRDSSIIDDAETLDTAGFLGAEPLVTATYTRNEVEATTKHDIHTQGCFEVKIPSNVTNISKGAFQQSHQVGLLIIPESVTHIGGCAFRGCTSLASITLGESVTHIGSCAFRACTSLERITLGDSVTHIGSYAFGGCKSLERITLGESVTQIGGRAFSGCTSLERITLGESVTQIGNSAFAGCTSLERITLGESVTHIGDSAFNNCTSLERVILGESVTQIGTSAFEGCISLERITLGESVTQIGDRAFACCASLKSITIPESLRHKLTRVLGRLSVAVITIPARQGRKRLREE